MVTNNEAVDNFLNGKRNLAVYQFSQLIKDQSINSGQHTSSPSSDAHLLLDINNHNISSSEQKANKIASQPNSDEIAFNYAMINLFTGCPQRASVIFNDLVKRYPRNPRLWLRLAESMLAAERAKMSEFEHIQQLSYPHSRDHLIKPKNKPILIKINPNYCQQQIQQQFQLQKGTPSNFLITIKGHLKKSLELVNEYNDISLMPEEMPNNPTVLDNCHQHSNQNNTITSTTRLGQQHHSNSGINAFGATTSSPTSSAAASPPLPVDDTLTLTDNSPSTLSNSPILETNNVTSTSPPTTPTTSTATETTTQSRLSRQLSYANPYQSISRSDLYHLRNKIQLNLAYICLCMGEPLEALNYTSQCLSSSPAGYERVLAHLYHAEACILASRFDEAIQLLNLEVLNMAKNLSQNHQILTGDKSKRVLYGDEMHNQLESGALTTVITYNLSVAYAAKGEFANASKQLERSVQPTKPNPLQIIICLLYIQLQQGHLESAKRTILNNLPQFR